MSVHAYKNVTTGLIVELKTALPLKHMTAKCISVSLSKEQEKALGVTPNLRTACQLSIGRVYTILGVLFTVRSTIFGSSPVFELRDDFGSCNSVPACLLEVVDGRGSQYCRAKQFGAFDLALWPEEFYRDFFHDRLSDGVPEAVDAFIEVSNRLEHEFDCTERTGREN